MSFLLWNRRKYVSDNTTNLITAFGDFAWELLHSWHYCTRRKRISWKLNFDSIFSIRLLGLNFKVICINFNKVLFLNTKTPIAFFTKWKYDYSLSIMTLLSSSSFSTSLFVRSLYLKFCILCLRHYLVHSLFFIYLTRYIVL